MKHKEPMATMNESLFKETLSEEPESILTSLVPKKKKEKIVTGSQSAPFQKDADVIKGAHLLLEAFFQHNVSIKESILPNAICIESTSLQESSLEGEKSQMKVHTQSAEHIILETPLLTQGKLSKIFSEHTTLIISPIKQIFLEIEEHIFVSHEFKHQTSLFDVPNSSDTVHDIVLTTHDLHSDIEGMNVGAYPDDNITNLRVPEFFTSSMENISSTSIVHNVEEEMSSQDKGDVDDTHAKKLCSSIDSPVIPILAPNEQFPSTHPEVIDESTKKLVDEMIT